MNGSTLVFTLTLSFFFVELVGGFYYNSLALVTDAAFMAINLLSQIIAIYVNRLSRRPPDNSKTFGYERAKVLSGLFHGILVGFMLFYVLTNAYRRILNPEPLVAEKVLIIAIIGFLVNGYGVVKLYEQSSDIGVRGTFLFVLNDALGSVAVIASTVIIMFTGFNALDAVASVIITLLVVYPSYFLVKESIHILMEGSPSGIDIEKVENFIYENFGHAKQVKELHIWSLVPEKKIMTVKIRTEGDNYSREKIKNFKNTIKKRFGIQDVFVEVYEEER